MSITGLNTSVSENFNSMGNSNTASIPGGFRVNGYNGASDWNTASAVTNRSGGTQGTLGLITGSSSGGIYNFANDTNATSLDRALGILNSGSTTTAPLSPSSIVLKMVNNTGSTIQSIFVSYDYEKYRTARRAWSWYFMHGSSSNPTTDTVPAGFQFYPADSNNTTVPFPPQSVSKSFLITNLNIAPGGEYYFRWVLSSGNSGYVTNGQALAIDNFCIKAFDAPPGAGTCTPPTTLASFTTLTPSSSTFADLQFSTQPGTNSLVIASTVLSPAPVPVSGAAYTSNANYGSGSQIGNGYVVYDGTGSSATILNLNPSTKYYFFVYSYNYNSSSLSCSALPLPCYATTGLPVRYVDSLTTSGSSAMRTWKFKSKQSGLWSAITTWSAFNPNTSTWINADIAPDENSAEILVDTLHTVDVNSRVSMDSVLIKGILRLQTGGIMDIKNGAAEYDVRVLRGGVFRVASADAYATGMLITNNVRINVADSGKVVIGEGGLVGANYGALAYTSGLVNWNNNSVFDWNSSIAFTASGVEYFPDTTAGVIPIFRLSVARQIGAAATTSIYGLFQANANATFIGSGIKVLRNGILHNTPVTFTQSSGCGQLQINGPEAIIGGTGAITLSTTAADTGMLISSPNARLLANKTFTNNKLVISGTLHADTFRITPGNAGCKLLITGLFTTKNPNGFYGSSTTSINASGAMPVANIQFPVNDVSGLRGTVDYISDGTQIVTSLTKSGVTVPYGNLSSSGSGNRTYTNASKIMIEGSFNPGIASYTASRSTIEFMKTGDTQYIPGFNYHFLLLSNAGVKQTAGTSQVPITIADSIKVGNNVSFRLVSDVVLRSTDSLTARMAVVGSGASVSYSGSGGFVVERFIKAGRKWQFLSAPISSSVPPTIKQSWMENASTPNANPNPGYGTVLTINDAAWSANGYDGFSPGGPSLKKYNSAIQGYESVPTTGSFINNDYGYFLFVRGDRSCLPTNSNVSSTILRMKGRLWLSSLNVPVPDSGWVSVGNPYASAIDFSKVRLSTNAADPPPNLYFWDPQMTGSYGVGAFITYSFNPVTRQYDGTSSNSFLNVGNRIESGQAFFLNMPVASVGRSLGFADSCRITGSRNVFRPGSNLISDRLRIDLKYQGSGSAEPALMDGCLVFFDDINNNSTDEFDAPKLMNSGENIAIRKPNVLLAIEKRKPVAASDTIHLYAGPFRYPQYIFEIDASDWRLSNSLKAYIFDNQTNSLTPLPAGEITRFEFNVDTSRASRSFTRFSIVFRRPGLALGTTGSQPSNAITESMQEDFENSMVRKNSFVTLFPNPVQGNNFHVQASNARTGIYWSSLITSGGQQILAIPLFFINGRAAVQLSNAILPGNYRLVINSADGAIREQVLFIKK